MHSHIIAAATQCGISANEFEGWNGTTLAVYDAHPGASADPSDDNRRARERDLRGAVTVDVGNRAFAVPQGQGIAFRAALDALEVPYERHSLGAAFMRARPRIRG